MTGPAGAETATIQATIDGREVAPAAMHPLSFWENGVPLPFVAARYSGLSVGVPGTVETWVEALEKFGTMSLAEVFAPAIHVARHGSLHLSNVPASKMPLICAVVSALL